MNQPMDGEYPLRNPVGLPGLVALVFGSGWLLWEARVVLNPPPDAPWALAGGIAAGVTGICFLLPAWSWLRARALRIAPSGLYLRDFHGRAVFLAWPEVGEVRVTTFKLKAISGQVRKLEIRWTGGRLRVPPTIDLTDTWEKLQRHLTDQTRVIRNGRPINLPVQPE